MKGLAFLEAMHINFHLLCQGVGPRLACKEKYIQKQRHVLLHVIKLSRVCAHENKSVLVNMLPMWSAGCEEL